MPDIDPGETQPADPSDDRPAEATLLPEVVAKREQSDEQAQRLGPSIDAHIAQVMQNCRIALEALASKHAYLGDNSDLDLDGETRWAVRWILAAAAIAYANALVDLSDRGHVDTALPVSRTLHEALGVLAVINDDDEETILKRWLEDREVRPKKVRAAAERQAQRVTEEAAARGVHLEIAGLNERMEQIYATLSDVSHIRRCGVRSMFSVPLRRAIYGRHPDPLERARGAASTVLSVEATIIGVGDVLAMFYGGPYYGQVIKPIQDGLMDSAAQLLAVTS
jgi:hypothetical protein